MSRIDVLAVLDREIAFAGRDAFEVGRELIATRAAVAELLDTANAVRQFLRSQQWGNYDYMEGTEVYTDLEDYAKAIDDAIASARGK